MQSRAECQSGLPSSPAPEHDTKSFLDHLFKQVEAGKIVDHKDEEPSSDAKDDEEFAVDEASILQHGRRHSSTHGGWGREEAIKMERHLKVLDAHAFFHGLRPGAISALARMAQDQYYPAKPDSRVLFEKTSTESESLFVIEKGAVEVEEGGEKLGRLEAGAVFGEAVSFGRLKHQPFTVKLTEEALQVLVIPNTTVKTVLRHFPEVRFVLEERMDKQVRGLLHQRVDKLGFFAHCMPKFFAQLLSKMELQYFEPQSDMFLAKAPADSMVMVALGSCKVTMPRTDPESELKRKTMAKSMAKTAAFMCRAVGNGERKKQSKLSVSLHTLHTAPPSPSSSILDTLGRNSASERSSTTLPTKQGVVMACSGGKNFFRWRKAFDVIVDTLAEANQVKVLGRRHSFSQAALVENEDRIEKPMRTRRFSLPAKLNAGLDLRKPGSFALNAGDLQTSKGAAVGEACAWQRLVSGESAASKVSVSSATSTVSRCTIGVVQGVDETREPSLRERAPVPAIVSDADAGAGGALVETVPPEEMSDADDDAEVEVESVELDVEGENGDDNDSIEDSDVSDLGSSGDEQEALFELPPHRENLEPPIGLYVVATAGPEALAFGDDVLMGLETQRKRHVRTVSDCICFVLSQEDFKEIILRHPRERKRFEEIAHAGYLEWQKCGLKELGKIPIFSGCSEEFLSAIANYVEPLLVFPGDDLVQEGAVPKRLLLLMKGEANTKDDQGDPLQIVGPYSIGTREALNIASSTQNRHAITAASLCQVLGLSCENLLAVLQDFPRESTRIVSEGLKASGLELQYRRSSLAGEEGTNDNRRRSGPTIVATHHIGGVSSQRRGNVTASEFDVWYMPFCQDRPPEFVEQFTLTIERTRLMPGQCLFRAESAQHEPTADEQDFLVVLLGGSVYVDHSRKQPASAGAGTVPRPHHGYQDNIQERQSPLVIVGFQRQDRWRVSAAEVSEVNRMSIGNATKLARNFPYDMRCVLERLMRFQATLDANHPAGPWWRHTTTLRHQSYFEDSNDDYLRCIWEASESELYMPGEVLVAEGDVVDSTLLLKTGTAVVEKVDTRSLYISDPIGDISDGYWIGEMMMFAGETKRKATIRATTVCHTHRLMTRDLVEILGRFPLERQRFRELAEAKLRALETERLEDLDFFSTLDKAFLTLLRPKFRTQVFFAGEVLMKQGDVADTMFVFGSDSSVLMEVDGVVVKEQVGRACLGVKALLTRSVVKRASTVITQHVCSVRTLTRDDWLETLKHDPLHRQWIKRFTEEQLERIQEERTEFNKKLAWEKIQDREASAIRKHRDRRAGRPPAPPPKQYAPPDKENNMAFDRPSSRFSVASRQSVSTPERPSSRVSCLPERPSREVCFSRPGSRAEQRSSSRMSSVAETRPSSRISIAESTASRSGATERRHAANISWQRGSPVPCKEDRRSHSPEKDSSVTPTPPPLQGAPRRPNSSTNFSYRQRMFSKGASVQVQHDEETMDSRETWKCFNDRQIAVPHTRLPQLGTVSGVGRRSVYYRKSVDSTKAVGFSASLERPRPSRLSIAAEAEAGSDCESNYSEEVEEVMASVEKVRSKSVPTPSMLTVGRVDSISAGGLTSPGGLDQVFGAQLSGYILNGSFADQRKTAEIIQRTMSQTPKVYNDTPQTPKTSNNESSTPIGPRGRLLATQRSLHTTKQTWERTVSS